jgi:hypothetical protein
VPGERTRARRRRFRWAIIAIVAVSVLAGVAAVPQSPARASAMFSGIAAFVTLAAVVLAAIGAQDLLRRPELRMWLELRPLDPGVEGARIDESGGTVRAASEEWGFHRLTCVVHNDGDKAMLGALVNVIVLDMCVLREVPADERRFRLRVVDRVVEEEPTIVPGEKRAIRFAAAHADYGVGHFILHEIEVKFPGPGDWPVKVDVDGDNVSVRQRFVVTVLPRDG